MIDSTNPRVLADQIRELWNKIKSITGLPSTTSATAGQILKLDSEKNPSWSDEYSYIPPAYSTEEINTGQKWLNGKDIYRKSILVENLDSTAGVPIPATDVEFLVEARTIVFSETHVIDSNAYRTGSNYFTNVYLNLSTNTFNFSSGSQYNGESCYVIVYYTKVDPEPETKKKTTKK